MKIAIDLQPFQSGSRFGGIGRYSIELAKAMVSRRSGHRFTIILNDADPVGAAYCRAAFADLLGPDDFRTFSIPRGISEWTHHPGKVRAAELIREQFLAELDPDFIHVASLFEGLQEEVVTSVGRLFPADRTAVTLYDLIPLVQQEQYLAPPRALEHYLGKVEHLKRAGLLLAISEFSRQEAIDLLAIPPERVVNISSAADARFVPLDLTAEAAATLKRRYGIGRRFLMYTGSFDQRKNHAALLRAFGMLPPAVRAQFQLLIVGKGWDAMYDQLRAIARQAGLQSEDVIFAGHVDDADLVPLYNLCDLFVFPSMAEGFGLPVLEAMSCGVPTICSNTTSLPEVIGLAEATFDPSGPKPIAAMLHKALIDDPFRRHLRMHGLAQAKKFSWDESARRALESIESKHDLIKSAATVSVGPASTPSLAAFVREMKALPGIDQAPKAALKDYARCLASNRLALQTVDAIEHGERPSAKVGWVSTWNTRCGIAAYSRFLTQHWPSALSIFAPYADWTTQADESNVVRCWSSGTADPLHELYWQITAAGVEAVVIQFNYGFFEFDALARLIERLADAGIRVAVTFHSTNDPEPGKELKLLSGALARCSALIVHTARDISSFERLGLRENLVLLPQGVTPVSAIDAGVGQPSGAVTIATYGFALPHKGLPEVVEAFQILRKRLKRDLRLLMVNARYPVTESADLLGAVRQSTEAAGLAEFVTVVSDFLPDEQSAALLRRADVVVFAYQHTGESSSAAVRMGLAAGRPVAVTPLAIFDDVRASTFTLPGTSPESIAIGLEDLLEQLQAGSAAVQATSARAERWRQSHAFSKIAKELFFTLVRTVGPAAHYEYQSDHDLSAKNGKLSYAATQPPLKSMVGEVRNGKLVTTRTAGQLLYGPFVSAEAGRFRATLAGSISGSGTALLDVSTNLGSMVLAESSFSAHETAAPLPSIDFVVPDGSGAELEVRLKVDDTVHIELTGLDLEPVP